MMRSLGRSIGRKGRVFLSNRMNISVSADHYRFSSDSSRSAPFMHFSRYIHVDRGRDASGGSRLPFVAKILSFMENVVDLRKKEPVQEPRELKVQDLIGLKEGDTVDLSRLLFTKDRDYLIRCNDGQQVKMEQLADKMVVIYFDSILKMNKKCLRSLTHAYKDLPPEHKFEVVFVDTNEFDPALISDQHEQGGFGNELPNLPWNAIPLSDVKSKRRLKKKFRGGRVRMGTFVVINSAGVIMHWEAIDIFCRYGVAGYPFTRKKIDELKSEDDKDAKNPSLNALLASHKRDYLISNKGEKVPIRTLEDKVVALFFYTGCQLHHDFTAKLKVAYEELRVKHQDFEVVLIYLYDLDYNERVMSEETFSETFKTMPWLALPYGDSSYYKLKRLFFLQWHESEDYGLIVIGPRMEFIQPFGISMLEKFKSPAYPFSYERVAELVAEKAKELELKMLWHPDGVFGGKYRSEEVKLDEFVNKNVIVLYDCYGIPHYHAEKIIYKLKERYHELMGTSDEFEVIDITSDSATYEYVKDLPWNVVHLDHDYTDEPNLFGLPGTYTRIPSLLAFDRNGRMVRKTMFPTFEDTKFPFYSGSMDKEVLSHLIEVLEWDQFQYITGSIYTYKKNSD